MASPRAMLLSAIVVLVPVLMCGVQARPSYYSYRPPPPAKEFSFVVNPQFPDQIKVFSPSGKVLATALCRAPLIATTKGCKFPPKIKNKAVKIPTTAYKQASNGQRFLQKKVVNNLVKALKCEPDKSGYVNIGDTFYKVQLLSYCSDKVELSLQAPIQTLSNSSSANTLGSTPLTLELNPAGDYTIVAHSTPPSTSSPTPSPFASPVVALPPLRRRSRNLLRTLTASDWFNCGGGAIGAAVLTGLVALFACLVTLPFYAICVALSLGIAAGATFITCTLAIALLPEGGNSCFPADALLSLPNGYQIPMAQLQIGHAVASGPTRLAIRDGFSSSQPGRFSEIYAFGHRDAEARTPFFHILLASNNSIEVSPRHFLPYSSSLRSSSPRFKYAKDIVRGDYLWESSKGSLVSYALTRVVATKIVIKQGLYNPLSLSGTIEVNGVIASCHSEWFLDDVVPTFVIPHLPAIYQGVLFPARVLYNIVGSDRAKEIDAQFSFHTSDGSFGSFVRLMASATKATLALPASS